MVGLCLGAMRAELFCCMGHFPRQSQERAVGEILYCSELSKSRLPSTLLGWPRTPGNNNSVAKAAWLLCAHSSMLGVYCNKFLLVGKTVREKKNHQHVL